MFFALLALAMTSCDFTKTQATSDSGVKKATVTVQTDQNGNTVEQKNVAERYTRDNVPGGNQTLICYF